MNDEIKDPSSPLIEGIIRKANDIADDLIICAAFNTEKRYTEEEYEWACKVLKAPSFDYFGY